MARKKSKGLPSAPGATRKSVLRFGIAGALVGAGFSALLLAQTWSSFPYGSRGALLFVVSVAGFFASFGLVAAWLFHARNS